MGAEGTPAGSGSLTQRQLAQLRQRFTGWDFEAGQGWVAAHREDAECTRHAIGADARALGFLLERIRAEKTPC